jgi:hypothetical protein
MVGDVSWMPLAAECVSVERQTDLGSGAGQSAAATACTSASRVFLFIETQ